MIHANRRGQSVEFENDHRLVRIKCNKNGSIQKAVRALLVCGPSIDECISPPFWLAIVIWRGIMNASIDKIVKNSLKMKKYSYVLKINILMIGL